MHLGKASAGLILTLDFLYSYFGIFISEVGYFDYLELSYGEVQLVLLILC